MASKPAPDATDRADEPLPLTLRFVLVIGALFFVGWFLMFALLWERW
jgi:hypothetical protein